MDRTPEDAPLLYRAKYLTAAIEEDRRSLEQRWVDIDVAYAEARSTVHRSSQQRWLIPFVILPWLLALSLGSIALANGASLLNITIVVALPPLWGIVAAAIWVARGPFTNRDATWDKKLADKHRP